LIATVALAAMAAMIPGRVMTALNRSPMAIPHMALDAIARIIGGRSLKAMSVGQLH
jgi:hypothetical protein